MTYPDTYETKIGFDQVRELLAAHCLSEAGVRQVTAMTVAADAEMVRHQLALTAEFQQILSYGEPFPSDNYNDTEAILDKLRIEGTFPEAAEVMLLRSSLDTVRRIIAFLRNRKDGRYPLLAAMAAGVTWYPFVTEAIDRVIDSEGRVRDSASPDLKQIRGELTSRRNAAVRRLHAIMRQAQTDGIVERDATVAVRHGRGVIPVSAANKRALRGFVHDESASGKTVFIEPSEVVEINNEITELEHREKREIVRILTTLADTLRPYIGELHDTFRFMARIDFIRAKAIFGNRLGSLMPSVADDPHIRWINARHPLLTLAFARSGDRKVVPLTITIGSRDRILVISGPNAGGKSVCLKSVALIQYMLQCGMTIPVDEGSEAGIFSRFFIDIGDEQSLENDLSTYSSHLLNMKSILRHADASSLVMIDEFGTGTEPLLGGALAEAVLAELNRRRAYGVITTHYTNLKHYATSHEGISNGAMAFDNQLMQPLFRLEQGKPGSSFAFEIARKIGLPREILADATARAGEGNVNFDRNLREIARDKRYWEKKREAVRKHEKRLEEMITAYETQLGEIKSQKKEIIGEARTRAEEMLRDTNRVIENTIRLIREEQAEKERTRELREELERYRRELKEEELQEEELKEEVKGRGKEEAKGRGKEEVKGRGKEGTKERGKERAKAPAPGDYVRISGTGSVGEIVEIRGTKAQIVAGGVKMIIDISKTEPVSSGEYRKSLSDSTVRQQSAWGEVPQRSSFSPEIDVRGMRAEEALREVQELIDTALVIQFRQLRIVHGKGNGILRELIRRYLESTGVVSKAGDEHVDRGGAGVTIVELDI